MPAASVAARVPSVVNDDLAGPGPRLPGLSLRDFFFFRITQHYKRLPEQAALFFLDLKRLIELRLAYNAPLYEKFTQLLFN